MWSIPDKRVPAESKKQVITGYLDPRYREHTENVSNFYTEMNIDRAIRGESITSAKKN
jgi:hypothetical protein